MTKPDSVHGDQIAYWNGKAGSYWAATTDSIDRAFAPFGDAAVRVANAVVGENVLDIGCGAGATSRALAAAVAPSGHVVGLDVSEALLADAKQRAEGVANLEFLLADAAAHSFDATFDVLFSRFGVMFFGDPAVAFGNFRNALRPGGRLVFVCWRVLAENRWSFVPYQAALTVVEPPTATSPDAPGPHAFAREERIRDVLAKSGYANVTIDPFDAEIVLSETGMDEAVEFAMNRGPASRLLAGVEDDVRKRAATAMRAALAPFAKGDRIGLMGATWIVQASRGPG